MISRATLKVLLIVACASLLALLSLDNRGVGIQLVYNTPKKVGGLSWGMQKKWIKNQEKEKIDSAINLGQMDDIIKQNSDPVPTRQRNTSADEICGSEGECIPPFRSLETRIMLSEKHKISTCVVQKSMSTVMTAIMCFLFNAQRFREAGREFVSECNNIRFCAHKNEYPAVWKVRKTFNISRASHDWQFTMVTRDPVDRFLSGFVDKCIRKPRAPGFCNGCRRNMTCFILSEYKRMMSQAETNRIMRTFEDRHFFPQNWRCNLKTEYKNYSFLRYSSDPSQQLMRDLFKTLRKQKVPEEDIRFIEDQLTKGRTVHSTVQSDARKWLERRLRSSPFLMEYIVRMFYHDFKLFHYQFPRGF